MPFLLNGKVSLVHFCLVGWENKGAITKAMGAQPHLNGQYTISLFSQLPPLTPLTQLLSGPAVMVLDLII